MDEALRPLGLRVTQAAALLYLQRQPGLSGAELARRLLLTPQSAATLLAGFEKKGWVSRTSHAVHRGFRETVLTAKGREVLRESVKVVARVDHAVRKSMNKSEHAQLHELLEKCLTNAQALLRKKYTF